MKKFQAGRQAKGRDRRRDEKIVSEQKVAAKTATAAKEASAVAAKSGTAEAHQKAVDSHKAAVAAVHAHKDSMLHYSNPAGAKAEVRAEVFSKAADAHRAAADAHGAAGLEAKGRKDLAAFASHMGVADDHRAAAKRMDEWARDEQGRFASK